ncbi:DEAD/DEAH box helicase [Amycolatopsis magusensis]|uniref:DEAD/DEAH box helicase n=1 Tax=Amycolatopsis magusensis TaxID=882444 RepID=UPI0024A9F6A0|nr:DEAD/DEAH box helicase [Amycolatopsis magusensis]MDI5978918.1 DEAD/DEAH box helicase [Amycolatopsis magusensis]
MSGRRPTQDTPGFAELGVPAPLVTALAAEGVLSPFPIQAATLPHSLEGRDVLGRGRTGSGKTYAFVVPLLARLAAKPVKRRSGRPRALILAPTRELVTQIDASLAPLAKALSLRTLTVFGGVSANPQITALRSGVDIVIACPGRLNDHLASGHVHLDAIEVTVLDEADHMADLGFLPGVRRILDATPADGQRLLFSATLDAGVDVIVKRYLSDPVTHSVDSAQSPVSTMAHHVLHVHPDDRLPVLIDLTSAPGRTLVFTRTKHRAKALTRKLNASGVPAVELHGNLGQNARTRNLAAFSEGTAKTLVATDIAARGIHVDDVTLVIHADPPVEHKAYLHRSGRTARAGASGTVITLMTDEQVPDVRDLTRKAGIKPRTTRLDAGHPLLTELAPGERSFVKPAPKTPQPQGKAQPTRSIAQATGQQDGSRTGAETTGRGNGRGRGQSEGRGQGRGQGQGQGTRRANGQGQTRGRDQDQAWEQSQGRGQGREQGQTRGRSQSQGRDQGQGRGRGRGRDQDQGRGQGQARGRAQGSGQSRAAGNGRHQPADQPKGRAQAPAKAQGGGQRSRPSGNTGAAKFSSGSRPGRRVR